MPLEFVGPVARDVAEPLPPPLITGQIVAADTAETIWTAAQSAPRTLQPEIGPSELGLACSRQIAYRLAGAVPVNMAVDPLPSVAGTALHAWLSDVYRAKQPPGRYLVDHPVSFRGVRGTLDLYDRRAARVVDWKFPRKAKARKIRHDGPPRHYRWQAQVYAAGLAAEGETPTSCAVVFVPVDGSLSEVFGWQFDVEPAVAEQAVDRLTTVKEQLAEAGSPAGVEAQPSRLCPWCPFYRLHWSGDLDIACPGES